MRNTMHGVLLSILVAVGCGADEDLGGATAALDRECGGTPFAQPEGTVSVDFVVDDSANRVYRAGDLKWKGSFIADPETRILSYDPFWSGSLPGEPPLSGWPTLYDDGPWTRGGHEPIGARAHDRVWGVTVFVAPPPVGAQAYEYGLIDASYQTRLGDGWIWKGPNGVFVVPAGSTEGIAAAGVTIPRFGKIDLQLAIDVDELAPGFAWDTSTVTVKSSAWGWGQLEMRAEGDGRYALELSSVVGRHSLLPHTGLLNAGETPELVFVLGGFEYFSYFVDPDGPIYTALTDGVTAGVRFRRHGDFAAVPIEIAANGNSFVTIP